MFTIRETTDRVRYQVRHFDLMGDFPAAWGVIVRANLVVTPGDISPELAAHIRLHLKNLHPHDRSDDRLRWREDTTTPPASAETTSVIAHSA